jgi:hypothetical protein
LQISTRLRLIRDKFWLWLYQYAGRHVGPGVDEYWDHHWMRFLRLRLAEDSADPDRILLLSRVFRDSRKRRFVRREQRDRR